MQRHIETNIGNLNREIKKTNALIAAIKKAITKIKGWLTDIKAGIKKIEMEPKEILLIDLLIQRFNERKEEHRKTYAGRDPEDPEPCQNGRSAS